MRSPKFTQAQVNAQNEKVFKGRFVSKSKDTVEIEKDRFVPWCCLCHSLGHFPNECPTLAGNNPKQLVITIGGQIRGGKNNMIVTRSGLHFPKPAWAKWRDATVAEVKAQLPRGFTIITEPVKVSILYISGDKRRRDQPAILDSLWHVLEKAGVVEDDTLLWCAESSRGYDKSSPRAIVTFL